MEGAKGKQGYLAAARVRVEESYAERRGGGGEREGQGRGSDVLQGTGAYPRYFAWLVAASCWEGEAGSVLMETGQRRTESELPPLCDGEGVYSTGVSYIADVRAARYSNAIGRSTRQGDCSHTQIAERKGAREIDTRLRNVAPAIETRRRARKPCGPGSWVDLMSFLVGICRYDGDMPSEQMARPQLSVARNKPEKAVAIQMDAISTVNACHQVRLRPKRGRRRKGAHRAVQTDRCARGRSRPGRRMRSRITLRPELRPRGCWRTGKATMA